MLLYNDVLNYTISINEYLYNNGFHNIFRCLYFNDPGILQIKHLNIPLSRPSNKDLFINIFAANEPNFSYDIVSMLSTVQNTKKKLILTSDYGNDYKNGLFETVYFFFQGYLALQWYKNYRHYKPFDTFTYKYNSSSRIIEGMRDYRLYLSSILPDPVNNQVSCSDVCPDTGKTIENILSNRYCFLNDHQKATVHEANFPYRYDHLDKPIPNTSFEIDWVTQSQSFLHVVNETVFYEKFNHLTEKIFKPIVLQRPFVLTSTPGSLAYLKQYGFQSFDKWWDESYDIELDPHRRLDMIAEVVKYVNSLSMTELHALYQDMLPVLEHNRNLFYGEFEDTILQELLVNYQRAVYNI